MSLTFRALEPFSEVGYCSRACHALWSVNAGERRAVPKGRRKLAGGGANEVSGNHRNSHSMRRQRPGRGAGNVRDNFRRPIRGGILCWCGFRWFRFAAPPANFRYASGVKARSKSGSKCMPRSKLAASKVSAVSCISARPSIAFTPEPTRGVLGPTSHSHGWSPPRIRELRDARTKQCLYLVEYIRSRAICIHYRPALANRHPSQMINNL